MLLTFPYFENLCNHSFQVMLTFLALVTNDIKNRNTLKQYGVNNNN